MNTEIFLEYLCTTLWYSAVSYTHLDVYKRQVYSQVGNTSPSTKTSGAIGFIMELVKVFIIEKWVS